jgi:uncharacterized membrane protein
MDDKFSLASPAAVRRAVRPAYAVALLGTLAWIAAIFLAPYLRSRSSGAASFLYAIFAPVCHQIPGRCFHFRGFPLAVCGRCLGIYVGFFGGLTVYPFVRGFTKLALPSVRLFVLLSLPAGIDFAGGLVGAWTSPIWVRFGTGLVWGVLLPYYFLTGVCELLLWRSVRMGGPSTGASPDRSGLDNPRTKHVE